MNINILNWQIAAWSQLLAHREKLPHALLVSGRPGLGKSALAEAFAMGLLCDRASKDGRPCGECQSCNWFSQGNHPDFRRLQPESMAPESEEESPAKKEKKKSDQIKIEQIRATEAFLAVGTHRGGARVILIDPADAMNATAQSALLKNLEEPPPGTVYLLVTSRPQRMLPTIRSRCRAVPMGIPPAKEALAWLRAEGVDEAESALAAAAGAPLAALAAAELEPARREFLNKLSDPSSDPLALALACDVLEPALVVGWLQRWVYDLLSVRLSGRIRYNAAAKTALDRLGPAQDPTALTRLLRKLAEARGLAQHPLNTRLFFEDLLLQYRAAMVRPAGR
jgi:DNA polymerase-3 subunit delta'